MKKITIIALCLSLLICSCSNMDSSVSTGTSNPVSSAAPETPPPASDAPSFINMHEFQLYNTAIRYNGISHPLEGYLIDESSYVFRLDDIADYFGLNVEFNEEGAIFINGNLDIKSSDYIPSLNFEQSSIDDRYTMVGIMNLKNSGEAYIELETPMPGSSSSTANTELNTSSKPSNRFDSAPAYSSSNKSATPTPYVPTDQNDFNFSSPADAGEIESLEKNNDQILDDFKLYQDVASKFYSRFYEVPNLTWAENSASVIQILNHPDNASYWYYVPNETKSGLEDEYATLLSAFGYQYAGSSGGYHTYSLNSNSVSFGYEGSDFIVNMSGLAKCNIGEEYANGFKSAGLTDFGKRFNISCDEELMYYGDWVYRYPLDKVNKTNAITLYINELEKDHFRYVGTTDGKSSYSDGNITVSMRTLDDNFYLSIIQ